MKKLILEITQHTPKLVDYINSKTVSKDYEGNGGLFIRKSKRFAMKVKSIAYLINKGNII